MIKTSDGISTKRVAGRAGDKTPVLGIKRERAVYTATGGETSIDLTTLSPPLSYHPGAAQISIKRSSGGAGIAGVDFYELTSVMIGFPSTDPLLPGEVVEFTKEVAVTAVLAAPARLDCYTATAEVGQSTISADFSWPYNINGVKGFGGAKLYINGVLQTRGIDFNEVSNGTASTNQLQLLDPLSGGENIIVEPGYQALDTSAAATSYASQQISAVQSILNVGSQAFVAESERIPVPSTSILNRASIPNISNDLRVSMGIDRIQVQNIYSIEDEIGPTGQRVYGLVGDDRGLVRFAGDVTEISGASGNYIQVGTESFVEITFYGTGLNALVFQDSTSRDFNASVDGGSPVTIISSGSGILSGRNYSANVIKAVAGGLTLGLHTVRLSFVTNSFGLHGFEILNEGSNLSINSGTAFKAGKSLNTPSPVSLLHTNNATGSRGGRQVVYMNADGSVSTAFRAVNSTSETLSSANHANEDLARMHFIREFGAGRTDDFSTMPTTASNRAFTLIDGTTTLVGSSVSNNVASGKPEGLYLPAVNAFWVFTFVGTGLDLLQYGLNNTLDSGYSLSIDGVTVAGYSVDSSSVHIKKIVSGLPYGTHTVKITRTGAGTNIPTIVAFKVYVPKKPSIPTSAIELADFNVLASYAAISGASIAPAQGVIRRPATREMSFNGTWTVGALDPLHCGGLNISSTAAGAYVEYTFYGTGIDYRWYQSTSTVNNTFSIDDSSNLSTYTTALTYGSGLTFTPSTGVLSGTGTTSAVYGASLSIRNLPLGRHKLRMTINSSGPTFYADTMDVITPIHSMSDSRRTTLIEDKTSSKVGLMRTSTSSTTTTSTVAVPLDQMSAVINLKKTGKVEIRFEGSASNSGTSLVYSQLYVDGQPVGIENSFQPAAGGGYSQILSNQALVTLAAGVHKIDVFWRVSANTGSAVNRSLTVKEQ